MSEEREESGAYEVEEDDDMEDAAEEEYWREA